MSLVPVLTAEGLPVVTSDSAPLMVYDGVPPPNCTPATATVVGALPFSATLDVHDAPEGLTNVPTCTTYGHAWNAVWYKYTAAADAILVMIGADNAPGSNVDYAPVCSVWVGTADALTELVLTTPFQTFDYCADLTGGFYFRLPVTPGTTYWIQVCHQLATTAPIDAVLAFSVSTVTQQDAPAGSILISDDSEGFPGVVLDPVTGEILRFLNGFPAGEFTDSQPTGEICAQSGELDRSAVFLAADLSTVATVSYIAPEFIFGIKSDRNGHFFIITTGTGSEKVYKYTAVGDLLQTWTLPSGFNGMSRFAVTRDGVRLYGVNGATNQPCKVYNLQTSTQESDLPIGVAGEQVAGAGDGYIADDGSLLFMKNTATACKVVRYDASTGAILQTYTPTTITFGNHFCFVDDVPGSFMIWGYLAGQTNNNAYFERIQLSDGAVLSLTPATQIAGASNLAGGLVSVSNSCPLFVLPLAILNTNLRLTQLPIVAAYDYSLLQPFLNAAALLWATPPPPES